jgi:hypothetical protein
LWFSRSGLHCKDIAGFVNERTFPNPSFRRIIAWFGWSRFPTFTLYCPMNEVVDQRVNIVTLSYDEAIPSLDHNSMEPLRYEH